MKLIACDHMPERYYFSYKPFQCMWRFLSDLVFDMDSSFLGIVEFCPVCLKTSLCCVDLYTHLIRLTAEMSSSTLFC